MDSPPPKEKGKYRSVQQVLAGAKGRRGGHPRHAPRPQLPGRNPGRGRGIFRGTSGSLAAGVTAALGKVTVPSFTSGTVIQTH